MDIKQIINKIHQIDIDCLITFKGDGCYDFPKFHRKIMELKNELKNINYDNMSVDELIELMDNDMNDMEEVMRKVEDTDEEMRKLGLLKDGK